MALWSNLFVLLCGDWRAVHPSLPHDLWVVLYVAVACTFIPTLITVLVQKHLSPVTVSFIYILEPILGAFIAMAYLHEMLPIQGYAGGFLVVAGAIIHTWGVSHTRRPSIQQSAGAIEKRTAVCQLSQSPIELTSVWNVQSHLQVGSLSYRVSRKGEKALVHRRRLDRLQRIGHRGMIQRPEEAWHGPIVPEKTIFIPKSYIEATEMRSR